MARQRVGIAYYSEGAGHATRMLAVAKVLESRGVDVAVAGGGPGQQFVELNGYDCFSPAPVDYIDSYQLDESLRLVLTRSLPNSGQRVSDYVSWFRRRGLDAVVTDDMFAAMAATLARVPLYVVTHNAPMYYDQLLERSFTRLTNELQRHSAREFFYPAVWPEHEADPEDVTRVGPIALESDRHRPGASPAAVAAGGPAGATAPGVDGPSGPADVQSEADGGGETLPPSLIDVDVLLVPSHFSRGFEELADRLRARGRDVTLVGGRRWEPVPVLLPYIRSADVVVCSGYSTVMEAAVAGTPVVAYPFTDEQRGVCRVIEETDTEGVRVVESADETAEAVADPPGATARTNGVTTVADRVVADL